MTEIKKDVEIDPSTIPDPEKDVDPEKGKEGDKDKNFAELRRKNEELERKLAELEAGKGKDDGGTRNLEPKTDPEPDPKSKKAEVPDALKVIFERDMKKAVNKWNKDNKATPEEWSEVKKRVSLKGDETDDEIYEKIQSAYESIPDVRKKRDQALIEKGKKIAMQDFQDDELDLGSGGDADMGGGGETRLTAKERKFASDMGMSPEEQKKIDKSGNSNQWQNGKAPVRKFFEGPKG